MNDAKPQVKRLMDGPRPAPDVAIGRPDHGLVLEAPGARS